MTWSPRGIPDTDAYTVMGSYKALDNAASGPMGMQRMLGEINRDGTTAHIPYMTTYEGYNQRIVLSNRSSAAADYEMVFRPEDGVTATATDMATGTLMGNSTVTMKATDLVMLEGGSRTAATIIVEGMRSNIDVTSVTVNRETGGHRHGGPSLGYVRLQLTAVPLAATARKGRASALPFSLVCRA